MERTIHAYLPAKRSSPVPLDDAYSRDVIEVAAVSVLSHNQQKLVRSQRNGDKLRQDRTAGGEFPITRCGVTFSMHWTLEVRLN